ncbi:MAG: outer membrane beta-barrel protein [Steroidobacteraceae bacterium]|nr:outer membrane beta-barrel protein [Steroidobacteraceae bacterium]
MRKPFLAGLTAALALASLPAVAADNGIYLGASVGQSALQVDDFDYDADATGYKLIVGWRFLDWLAVEGNYVDFGSGDDTVAGSRIETEADGISLSAVGFLPVGPVDLFARVGAIDWSADVSSPGFGSASDDGTDLTYGVGAQFRVWSLSIRAEYERFEVSDADLDMISVGLTWTFL